MNIRKLDLQILCLTILASLFYAWRAFNSGTLEYGFETNFVYFTWIKEIQTLPLNLNFLGSIFIKTAEEIRAPEPLAGVFYWCIALLVENPKYVFFISNIIFISLIYFCLSKLNNGLIFSLLFFLGVIFGQYEFAITDITHRFKVAVMFFFIYAALDFRGSKFSLLFLLGAILTHLSVLAALPIVFILKRLGLLRRNKVHLSVILIISLAIVTIAFFLFYLIYIFVHIEGIFKGFNQLGLVVFNKLTYFELPILVYPLFIIVITFAILLVNFMNKRQINRMGAIVLTFYILLSIGILGTGRMLMLYYFILGALVPSIINNKQSAAGIVLIASYFALFIYSIFKGFYLGGSNILINSIFGFQI